MVVTDSYLKPFYNKQKPRKVLLYANANWNNIHDGMLKLSTAIIEKINAGNIHVQELLEFFKKTVKSIMEQNIHTKTYRSNNSLLWFNRKFKKAN